MPIHRGQDKEGAFYRWGQTGKKYYFDPQDKESKTRALNKAQKQQTAIYSSGWKGDQRMAMKLIKVKTGDAGEYTPEFLELAKQYVENVDRIDKQISQLRKSLEPVYSKLTKRPSGMNKYEIGLANKLVQATDSLLEVNHRLGDFVFMVKQAR